MELRWQRPQLEIPLPPAINIIKYNIKTKFYVYSDGTHTHTPHLSHTTFSRTIFHTPSFTHLLCHTTLSHTIFHTSSSTPLCHTPSFTHHLSHTTLSHTMFHTQLCHTPSFTTPSLSHTIFPPPPPLSFLPSPSPPQHVLLIIGRSWLVGLSGPLI